MICGCVVLLLCVNRNVHTLYQCATLLSAAIHTYMSALCTDISDSIKSPSCLMIWSYLQPAIGIVMKADSRLAVNVSDRQ